MAGSVHDSSSTTSDNNSDEQVQLKELFKSIYDIASAIKSNGQHIDEINNIQDQVIKKGKIDSESQKLLISYYETVEQKTHKIENLLRKSLKKIFDIGNIRHQKIKSLLKSQRTLKFLKGLQVTAKTLPVWIATKKKRPPPLCGAIEPLPSYVAKSGDLVAALVEQSGEERWIVAEAVAFKNGKYEVEDIDVKEFKRNFTLEKKYVKPLPLMRADPVTSSAALFRCNTFVLAMYPKTTCFFKAFVKAPPQTCHDGYEILFEDEFNQYTIMMIVCQRFVVSLPSSKITKKQN